MKSVVKTYRFSFDPNALTTHLFRINAPPKLPIKDISKIKAYLVNGAWDDYGSIGSFSCPLASGRICTHDGTTLISTGTSQINGSVTNVVASNCSVVLGIEWVYEGGDCPTGTVRCETTNYPGYCCLPANSLKSEIRAMTQLVRRLKNG